MPKRKKTKAKGFLVNLRFRPSLLLAIVIVLAGFGAYLLLSGLAATPNTFDYASEKADVSHVNSARSSVGVKSLFWDQCLTDIARAWSKHMGGTQNLAHNTNLASQIDSKCGNQWTGAGENVGVGPSEADIFNAFMNSSAHKANILDSSYDFIGVGVWYDSGGNYWITQDFADCSGCGGNWTKAASAPTNCSSLAAPSSLLSNGGFESNTFGNTTWSSVRTLNEWFVYASSGTQPYHKTSANPHDGCYVMYANDPDTTNQISSVTQVVRGSAGLTYTLSGYYLYQNGTGTQSMYLDFLKSDWSRASNPAIVSTTHNTSWSPLTVSATAPSGTYYIRVILYGPSGGDNTSGFYWDTVKLTHN